MNTGNTLSDKCREQIRDFVETYREDLEVMLRDLLLQWDIEAEDAVRWLTNPESPGRCPRCRRALEWFQAPPELVEIFGDHLSGWGCPDHGFQAEPIPL